VLQRSTLKLKSEHAIKKRDLRHGLTSLPCRLKARPVSTKLQARHVRAMPIVQSEPAAAQQGFKAELQVSALTSAVHIITVRPLRSALR
jgi:hypothetical protein